jgi:hypothetical protein
MGNLVRARRPMMPIVRERFEASRLIPSPVPPPKTPFQRTIVRTLPSLQPQVIRVDQATFIPSGMHGTLPTYATATVIPSGMHSDFRSRRGHSQIEHQLIAKGIRPERARALVARAHRRANVRRSLRPSGVSGLGDVVADAMTWVKYGNDIIQRSKTGNVGEEAMKAAQNINTFFGNRGEELEAASHDTVTAVGEIADKLTKIATGQIKYDSVAGAFFDEFGNAVKGEVLIGVQGVLDAPKKVVKYLVDEVAKPALDVVPWYVWAAAAVGGAAVAGKALRLW